VAFLTNFRKNREKLIIFILSGKESFFTIFSPEKKILDGLGCPKTLILPFKLGYSEQFLGIS